MANTVISRLKGSTKGSGKMLIILGVIVVGVLAYSILRPTELPANHSTVQGPPTGSPTIQGGNEVSPAYEEALSDYDSQRIDKAKASGSSAIPTLRASRQEPVVPVIDLDPAPEAPPVVELPIVQQPVVVQQPLTTVPIVQQPAPMRSPEATKSMVDALQQVRRGLPIAEVTRYASGQLPPEAPQTPPTGIPDDLGPNGKPASKIKLPLAGTILYAEMVSRANSDAPGPVLARILQGEYEGATLIGSFETVRNALVIEFTQMTIKTTRDGEVINETIPIKSVAVETTYIGTALATSVDRHLFQKLAIGFTASFAKGFGDALGNNGTTTVTTDRGTSWTQRADLETQDQLLSAGGQAVSETGNILMDEFGKRPTTVMVDGGTPIGILFL